MKFLTTGTGSLAVVLEEGVVDLSAADVEDSPQEMLELVCAGEEVAKKCVELAKKVLSSGGKAISIEEANPRAPFPQLTRNIFCIGKNYAEHAAEVLPADFKGSAVPEKPIAFTKATETLNHPGAAIPLCSELTQALDYEAELAIVIGRKGKNIPEERAWEHVFGYTALNDITARDCQREHKQWFRGKSFDGFAPMGPRFGAPFCNARPKRPAGGVIRKRRKTTIRSRKRYDFRHPPFDRKALRRYKPAPGRHHRHRHAGRCRHGLQSAEILARRR